MLISIEINDKTFGDKLLYKNLNMDIQENEKIGLIGRNGTGKSTLFNIINGEDKDYDGKIVIKSGTILVSSRQEHHGHEEKTVLEYIQGDLPEYSHLVHIIDNFPKTMEDNPQKLQQFSDALDRFGQLGYYQVEDEIKQAFDNYQIDSSKIHQPFNSLSGGEKRMVELIKVQHSPAHIALVDEPTNHMDYVAKLEFIKWLQSAKEAILVITHDRDVLSNVDRIIEIRDQHSFSFKGNYESYLKINTNQVTSQINEYELTQRRITNLEEDVIRFRRLKEKSRDPGTIRRFKSQENKAQEELKVLRNNVKPSFWIDQESANGINNKLMSAYEKHKAQNIRLTTHKKQDSKSYRALVKVDHLSLGYNNNPLFQDINFIVREGERIRLHSRNGTGKSTIVKAIMATNNNLAMTSQCLAGNIVIEKTVRIGHYEQEINPKYLNMTLYDALEATLREKGMPITEQKIKQLMGDYLFNPMSDGHIEVMRLSGGQKARIQLISMLINDPELLILDEPTNHLDLPSIEELENSMANYHGAIIYISHDSFFSKKMGGETIAINP